MQHLIRWANGGARDGTLHQFDASKEPLVVRAGRGQVIPGWDVALPHIALNETVRLTIQPWLACGSGAEADVIPPPAAADL